MIMTGVSLYVGYKFSVETEEDIMTLHFEYPELDDE